MEGEYYSNMTRKDYEHIKNILGLSDHIERRTQRSDSYCFKKNKGENTLSCLKRLFSIDNKDNSFDKAYKMAIGGSGKEEEKIDTIWSSSLLSLLFFYDTVVVHGGITIKGIRYTKCFFEFQNPVLQKINGTRVYYTHPSNIDCVLVDKDNQHILFIESKFIEYIRDYRKNGITKGDKLSPSYGREKQSTEQLYNWFQKNINKPHYYYGMKQMITHYSGLVNFVNKKVKPVYRMNSEEYKEIFEARDKGAEVDLIEVVYKFDNKFKDKFDDYELIQKQLVEQINKNNKTNITVYDLTTYQDLLKDESESNKLSDNIKKYYSF